MIVIQHNCQKTYAVTIAILEIALERGAGVVCLQEPYIGKKEISHPGFTFYWPEAEDRREIRVVIAIKKDILSSWILEHRTDLINSTHIQCLDIWDVFRGAKARKTRLVNIYDQRIQGSSSSYRALQHIQWADIITRRTILAGDFNARSPRWDPLVRTPQNASYLEGLIDTYSLILNNTHDFTRREGSSQSIIDLTLSSIEIGPLEHWAVDLECSTPLDHEVIRFSWEDLEASNSTGSSRVTGWNIDQLAQDRERAESARQDWIYQQSLITTESINSAEQLDKVAQWTQETLTSILNTWAKPVRLSARSKRWWTEEVKEARALYSRERHHALGTQDYSQVKAARNYYYIVVRKAKQIAWERFLEGEEGESSQDSVNKCWIALRYTKAQA